MVILIIAMLIMNVQTKLYTILFFLTTQRPIHSQSLSSDCGMPNSQILRNSWKKDRTASKVWTPRWERIQTHRSWRRKIASCPPANPHSYTEHDICGVEYFHGAAWLAVWLCFLPAPAHLLISWNMGVWESLWFHSNTWKLQCIINILFILNQKHSSW